MSTLDIEILRDFVKESKTLIKGLVAKLEEIDGFPEHAKSLADYGNLVDRIMGGAKSLALLVEGDHALHILSDYTSICKAVSYKGSQIRGNDQFFNVVHAFLFDATEILEILIDKMESPVAALRKDIPTNFIERLKWLSHQFDEAYSASVDSQPKEDAPQLSQNEIDELMRKLGI